jgi:GNAT superfamily N-acetyltransferase
MKTQMTEPDTTGATARGARAVEWEACRNLVQRCGLDPDLFDLLTRTDTEHPPECLRLVDLGGRFVSFVLVVPRRILIAGVPVDGALVALVGTDPAHGGRGFAGLLLEDTVAFIRARGFRLALVRGLPDFYARFGFVSCLGEYAICFDPERVLSPSGAGGAPAMWGPLTDQDIPGVAALYASATAGTPGTVLRPPERWVWRDRGRGRGGLAVCRVDSGPVQAYVRWTVGQGGLPADCLGVSEVGAASPAALIASLDWTANKALEGGLARVRFSGPPDHLFSRLVYLRVGGESQARAAGAGQVLVTNRGLLMADLAQVLTERAAKAGLPPGTAVVLDVGAKRFELLYAGDRLRLLGGRAGRQDDRPVSRLSVEAFTAMALGSAGGDELEALPGVALAAPHREALAVLFPRAYPQWVPAPYW